ncbi:MAG: DNA mismatch repair endonuclease MutL [Mangrovibacterium sp.]
MSDIIQLLPESVANQIHAGEVVQRPSSVVKELVENAIDAGATQIKINIKDAGRTLIQVSDNGCGMSSTDARMAFELHATSKIRQADDLFNIRTMGFRGEALAAISIVADVELHTKQAGAELGTFIHIVGSEVKAHEATQCARGTNFMVKNLFFNTSARRKFLKADKTELGHIATEFQRLALANPSVGMSLTNNGDLMYDLSSGDNLRKRILSIFGKNSNQKLIPIDTPSSLVNISGFIGQPKYAKKRYGEQFFFVNGRYMKHAYFHKAVSTALDRLLPPDAKPCYFIFFEIDPQQIDVNVSPNKTEVKFEQERDIWHMLTASIRESLGRFNVIPSIDFDQQGSIEIPVAKESNEVGMPRVAVDASYNPFEPSASSSSSAATFGSRMNNGGRQASKNEVPKWDSLYQHFEQEATFVSKASVDGLEPQEESSSAEVQLPLLAEEPIHQRSFQLRGKYIVLPMKSGLMLINQRRAHERILYEKYLKMLQGAHVASQQLLFPQQLELTVEESVVLSSLEKELQQVGFRLEESEPHVFHIQGIPCVIESEQAVPILETMLQRFMESELDLRQQTAESMAENLASSSVIGYGKELLPEEQQRIVDQLFACQTPNYTPSGRTVFVIVPMEDLDVMF